MHRLRHSLSQLPPPMGTGAWRGEGQSQSEAEHRMPGRSPTVPTSVLPAPGSFPKLWAPQDLALKKGTWVGSWIGCHVIVTIATTSGASPGPSTLLSGPPQCLTVTL